jgi:hypothetical protein
MLMGVQSVMKVWSESHNTSFFVRIHKISLLELQVTISNETDTQSFLAAHLARLHVLKRSVAWSAVCVLFFQNYDYASSPDAPSPSDPA